MRWLVLCSLAAGAALSGATLEVHNRSGGIWVTVVARANLRILGAREDVRVENVGDRVVVQAVERDGRAVDLRIELPLGYGLEAHTESGSLTVEGMIHYARLTTVTGAVRLKVPLAGSRFQIDSEAEPGELHVASGVKLLKSVVDLAGGRRIWRYRDALPERAPVYGNYRVSAKNPAAVTLENWIVPKDWPLRFHWQAPDVLEALSRPKARGGKRKAVEAPQASVAEEGVALFRSDVRMVNFVLAVSDRDGRPVPGLSKNDFEVFEEGKRQQTVFAGADDVPFNLAILLDLSGSARLDREPMRAAAEGFIRLAGEGDRVAVYALAGDMFHVISPLSDDREALLKRIARLPDVAGASPLYDAVTLAYADAFGERAGERNALIVVSDGIDNQVSKQELPSSVKYKRLLKEAERFEALIYPVFLRSGERFGRGWSEKARKRMEELAAATGGRLFPAASIEDLAPVFKQVEDELRSVYSIAYYPDNQSFDGRWRKVEVKVKRPRVVVRAREGYYGR